MQEAHNTLIYICVNEQIEHICFEKSSYDFHVLLLWSGVLQVFYHVFITGLSSKEKERKDSFLPLSIYPLKCIPSEGPDG